MRVGELARWRPRMPTPGSAAAGAVIALLLASAAGAGEAGFGHGGPAARRSSAADATEYWDLNARFDSGYRLFERFVITNEGPGTQTAAAAGYIIRPDGQRSEVKNGRRQGEWRLSADGLRLDVASSSLDLHGPRRRLVIDSTSQGVRIDLHVPAGDPPPVAGAAAETPYRVDVLQIAAPIEGTIWVRGMDAPAAVRGSATLTHVWMDDSESRLAQRRIEFSARTANAALYVAEITTPAGERRHWLALERDGRLAYQTSASDLTLAPARPLGADRDYPLPGELIARDGALTVEIQPQRVLLRTDPLGVVPQPFRFFLSLRSAPQRVWADAAFHLRLAAGGDGAPFEADGEGILAVDFLNPLPSSK